MAAIDPDWCNPERPPGVEWLPGVRAIDVAARVWVAPDPHHRGGGEHLVWHWCTERGFHGWRLGATAAHTLVSRDPLTIEPSLLWPCCGVHGFIRAGRWVAA